MRYTALLIAVVLSCPPASAFAAPIVEEARKDAVELRLSVTGASSRPAQFASYYVPIVGHGSTLVAAQADADRIAARLGDAMTARGISRSDLTVLPASPSVGIVGNAALDGDDPAPMIQAVPPSPDARRGRQARMLAYIRLSNMALESRLREALDDQNLSPLAPPAYGLTDPQPARGEAIENALTKARREAEAYAAPLGLKVARLRRISNSSELVASGYDIQTMLRVAATGVSDEKPGTVLTQITIWADFDLVAR